MSSLEMVTELISLYAINQICMVTTDSIHKICCSTMPTKSEWTKFSSDWASELWFIHPNYIELLLN